MLKFNSLAASLKPRSSFRATSLIRPGGDAILLMGVAFGCAQLGWGAIFPEKLEPHSLPVGSEEGLDFTAQPLVSPFAPTAPGSVDAAGAHAAALAGIRVVGVRQADIAEDSGAILAFPDGQQRPFLVGHEITDGVVLSRVESSRIVVAFDGGEQALPVEGAATTGSFALVLMGRSSATPAPAAAVAPPSLAAAPAVQTTAAQTSAAQAQTVATGAPVSSPTVADAQWLADTMAHVEMRNGAPYAWRVASAPPSLAANAGLQIGDLILSVNGNPPGEPSALVAAATASRIQIAVERPSGERRIVTLAGGTPS